MLMLILALILSFEADDGVAYAGDGGAHLVTMVFADEDETVGC